MMFATLIEAAKGRWWSLPLICNTWRDKKQATVSQTINHIRPGPSTSLPIVDLDRCLLPVSLALPHIDANEALFHNRIRTAAVTGCQVYAAVS